ncbi:MAG: hypothetical protein RJQ04_05640 [Longimicrobiales bacterium]
MAAIGAALALTAGACSDATAGGFGFPGAAPSLDALGRATLQAVVQGDTARLDGFRLTRQEHNDVVWPELPASAPEVGMPVDLVWADIERRNDRALNRILPALAGRRLDYVGTSCRGGLQAFGSFHVLTDCWVTFDAPDRAGEGPVAVPRFEVQFFKDVLVRDAGYKVFRYYEELPRPAGRSAVP